jgi:hypothetical protein
MGGSAPYLATYDENFFPLGFVESSARIDVGTYKDITIKHNRPKVQPTYLVVVPGADSICIAYISQTWPDGTKVGWLGDIGEYCGYSNYYSNIYVTMADGGQYKVSSRCIFLRVSLSSNLLRSLIACGLIQFPTTLARLQRK